jgi:hypothetical protein
MQLTRRRGLVVAAALVVIGLTYGFFRSLSTGPSVVSAKAIVRGTVRADIEAAFGQPAVVGPMGLSGRPSVTFAIWELGDGWTSISFDADDRATGVGAYTESWTTRKWTRLKWALGW